MMPGMNPRKMNQMMRKMGISQVEVDAQKVIIRTKDTEIVISNPSVSKVKMMGQTTYQVSGSEETRELSTSEEGGPAITEEDIKTVMEQAGVGAEEARKAIEKHEGDLAEAIMSLENKAS